MKFVEEVKGKSKKEDMKEVAKKERRTGAVRMGATELRIK